MQFRSAHSMTRFIFLLFSSFLQIGNNMANNRTSIESKGFLDYLLGNGPRFCKCLCGRSNSQMRILGGEYLESNQFPWLVIVNLKSTTSVSGTLINDRYVITSANQVLGMTPYDIKVTVGEYNRCSLDTTTVNQSVDAIKIHPEYDPLTRGNDLALIRLSNAVTIDRWISPICLPQPAENYVGFVGTIIGWDAEPISEDSALKTCRPRKIGLPILSDRECYIGSANSALYTRDKSCAGVLGSSAVICATDSGSPVVHYGRDGFYQLIGVLTDSNICNEQSPTLFTKINEHFSWLFQHTRDGCYCGK